MSVRTDYDVSVVLRRQERPYHSDSTASRLLSDVKHCRARFLLRWGTTLESLVLFFCSFPFCSSCISGRAMPTSYTITALYSTQRPLFCLASWLLFKQIGGCTRLFILGFGFDFDFDFDRRGYVLTKQLSYIMICCVITSCEYSVRTERYSV